MMMKTGRREKMKALKVAALFTVCRMIEDHLSAFSDGDGRNATRRRRAGAVPSRRTFLARQYT